MSRADFQSTNTEKPVTCNVAANLLNVKVSTIRMWCGLNIIEHKVYNGRLILINPGCCTPEAGALISEGFRNRIIDIDSDWRLSLRQRMDEYVAKTCPRGTILLNRLITLQHAASRLGVAAITTRSWATSGFLGQVLGQSVILLDKRYCNRVIGENISKVTKMKNHPSENWKEELAAHIREIVACQQHQDFSDEEPTGAGPEILERPIGRPRKENSPKVVENIQPAVDQRPSVPEYSHTQDILRRIIAETQILEAKIIEERRVSAVEIAALNLQLKTERESHDQILLEERRAMNQKCVERTA